MEIVNEGQVAINDVVFSIEGRVRRFVASQFAPKQVIGGYDDESDPIVSTFTWNSFGGGLGKYLIESPADASRSRFTTAHTDQENLLSIAPAGSFSDTLDASSDTQLSLRVNPKGRLEEFGNKIFFAWPAGLIYTEGTTSSFTPTSRLINPASGGDTYSAGQVGWAHPSDSGPVAGISDMKSGSLNDSAVLIFANDSGSIQYSSSPTDSTAWSTDSAHGTVKFEFYNDLLWGMTSSGELAFTPDITSGWTQITTLPVTDTGQILQMFVGPRFEEDRAVDGLYVVTKKGLFLYDSANETFFPPILETPDATFSNTTIDHTYIDPADVFNESIYYAYQKSLFRITPAPGGGNLVDLVSPTYFEQDELGTSAIGPIIDLEASPTGLFLLFGRDERPGNNSTLAPIGFFDGQGFRYLPGPATSSTDTLVTLSQSLHMGRILFSNTGGRSRVFRTGALQGGQRPFEIHDAPLIRSDVATDTRMDFVNSQHDFPFFDGFISGTKLATGVRVRFNITDTEESFQLRYRTDPTDSFREFANTQDDGLTGTQDIVFPITDTAGDDGLRFNQMQLSINMKSLGDSTHNNHSPRIRRVSLNYIKSQSLRWGYRLAITGSPQLSNTELFDTLEQLFVGNRIHEFTSRNTATGQPEVQKVRAFNLEAAEEAGYSGKADYILTLVQAL